MLARNQYFDCVAFAICLFYIISLGCDRFQIEVKYKNILQSIDMMCAVLLVIETALRLHSLRRMFLLNFWNFYDSVTVILQLIGKLERNSINTNVQNGFNFIKLNKFILISDLYMLEFSNVNILPVTLLRVIRVLRFNSLLVAYSPSLKSGLKALRRSTTAAYNLCLFLFLMIFVYALIGTVAFKDVQNITEINEKITFQSIDGALILMFQISTSAGWDGLYKVLTKFYNFNRFAIFLYIWSFLFICILTIVNLVLTIILNYYVAANQIENDSKELQRADLMDFNERWNTLAKPNQPIFINKEQLPILLNQLDRSSALRITPNEENIQLLGIPVQNDDQLYRGDVLIALNKNRLRQTNAKK